MRRLTRNEGPLHPAGSGLQEIYSHIAQDNQAAARKVIAAIRRDITPSVTIPASAGRVGLPEPAS